jgi:LuxR family maltose regulon positive regulatory protein
MASEILLQTKLFVPRPRPDLVARPRLLERLPTFPTRTDNKSDYKLTLISAPAGYGKSTLLGDWAWQLPHPVAWLSLDKRDNDEQRFWTYLFNALQTIAPGIGEAALAAVQSARPPPIETTLTGWINEITSLSAPLILVLDDYHLIDDRPVHDGLAYLLEHGPPNLHLVIATRSDPPLSLSRLRGNRQLHELRTDDLRFTTAEAAQFLNQVMGLALSAADIAALESRTEGWIVGLQMAALALQGLVQQGQEVPGLAAQMSTTGRTARFIASFTGSQRFILDYLTDEVLEQQPAAVQAFLLQTAILDRLSGPLCDAVTGRNDGLEMLQRLEQANLFIIPLDDQRNWYRYHHLFAELLGKRLLATRTDGLPSLHRNAGTWYEQKGLIAYAVHHAMLTGDIPWVSRLVGGNALVMMGQGALRELQGWLESLPAGEVRREPWLGIAHAWMRAYSGQLDNVEPYLQQIEQAITGRKAAELPVDEDHIRGHMAAIRACVAIVRGDTHHTGEYARQALDLLPPDDLPTRAWATMILGLTFEQSGDIANADRILSTALDISRQTGESHVVVLTLCNLSAVQSYKGRLVQAEATLREALQISEQYARQTSRRLPISAQANAALGAILCDWYELDEALRHLHTGVELARNWGEPLRLGSAYKFLAFALQVSGDEAGALAAIAEARRAASHASPWYARRLATMAAHIHLLQGDIEGATRWTVDHELQKDVYFDVFDYWEACLVRTQIEMAHGRWQEALALLTEVLQAAEVLESQRFVIEALVQQTVAYQALGELEQALSALQRAITLAAPERFVLPFLLAGEPLRKLLLQTLAEGVAVAEARHLLQTFVALKSRQVAASSGHTVLAEPLSEREMEVLRLLSTHLTRPEIAQQLYLSENTVRSHVRNIYGKLDVHSRQAAIQRAEELGLL